MPAVGRISAHEGSGEGDEDAVVRRQGGQRAKHGFLIGVDGREAGGDGSRGAHILDHGQARDAHPSARVRSGGGVDG